MAMMDHEPECALSERMTTESATLCESQKPTNAYPGQDLEAERQFWLSVSNMREGVDEIEEAGKLVTRDVGGITMVLFRAGGQIDF